MKRSLLIGSLFLLPALAFARVEKFKEPDIKNDFCGVHINFQYCKCAFHDEYCGAVGMDQGAANTHVYGAFDEWVAERLGMFQENCRNNGGIVDGERCEYCDAPEINIDGRCMEPEEESEETEDSEESEECLPEDFEDDWAKYSDIDPRLERSDMSYEAQQYLQAYDQIEQKMIEGFELEYDMELDRQARLELRALRKAIVKNQKQNLIKAMIRLTYVTYDTIKKAQGWGTSYANVVTAPEASVEVVGEALDLARTFTMSGPLVIDTKTDQGKVMSVVAGAELEALKSAGNPRAVAQKVFTDVAGFAIPKADITPEEIAILRQHYLQKRAIDDALQESYRINSERRRKVMELEAEVEALREEAKEWEAKEKERTQLLLEEECEE